MAITVRKLDKPTNVQAVLQSGGNLLPNTKYYVVVTAKNFKAGTRYYAPINGELISEASDEISFTTTETEKSAVITWDRPAGSTYYNVYISKVSGDYVDYVKGNVTNGGKRCGATGNNLTSEILDTVYNTNTYTITEEGTLNTAYILDLIGYGSLYDPNNPDKFLGILPKGNGTILISYNEDVTLKDICDYLTAQGYGDYFYYNNNNFFVLRGGFYIPSSETNSGSLKILNHTLIFFNGSIQNESSSVSLSLGEYSTLGGSKNGCYVYTNVLWLGNVKAYNTIFKASAINMYYPYCINDSNRWSILQALNLNNIKDCFFIDYSTIYYKVSNQYIINRAVHLQPYVALYGSGESNQWENVYIEAYGFFYTGSWEKYFRDCTIKNTRSDCFIFGLEIPRTYKFYDCNFIGDYTTNDLSTHKHNWYVNVGNPYNPMIAYYYSIKLKIVNKDNSNIDGARVVLKNNAGEIVLDTLTDSNGDTNKTDILVYKMEHNPSLGYGSTEAHQLRTNYNPFTLIVSKEGYDDYNMIFEFNQKMDRMISLNISELKISSLTFTHPTTYANGTISFVAAGGVAPYQYSIDGGTSWHSSGDFTGLLAGSYDIMVKDNEGTIVEGGTIILKSSDFINVDDMTIEVENEQVLVEVEQEDEVIVVIE